ncbi:MAG: DUF480 domain-containing protein [Gammaproteobacteria bacterium]|nr:DUF480 domain-containing protein [Gammaproteobacteria bacterium]
MTTFDFTAQQLRVLGALIEKEQTTPDYYPMTVNGITAACNQKSNREPVMQLTEQEVQSTLSQLMKGNWVDTAAERSSRSVKYKHRFCNSEFGQLKLNSGELAIVCCLMLRGAQTPGELRSRTQRMHEFDSVVDVEQALIELSDRSPAMVQQLAREPGKRESRWQHLLGDATIESSNMPNSVTESASSLPEDNDLNERVAALEDQVSMLIEQLNQIKQQ